MVVFVVSVLLGFALFFLSLLAGVSLAALVVWFVVFLALVVWLLLFCWSFSSLVVWFGGFSGVGFVVVFLVGLGVALFLWAASWGVWASVWFWSSVAPLLVLFAGLFFFVVALSSVPASPSALPPSVRSSARSSARSSGCSPRVLSSPAWVGAPGSRPSSVVGSGWSSSSACSRVPGALCSRGPGAVCSRS